MASAGLCAFGCPICVNEFKFKEQNYICTIPCGHVYHEQCLKEWFRVQIQEFRRSNCPKCRAAAEESQIIRLFLHETFPTDEDSMEEDADKTENDFTVPQHDDAPSNGLAIPHRERVHYGFDYNFEFDAAIFEFREWAEEHTRQIMRNHEGSLNNLDDHLAEMNSELAEFQHMLTGLVDSVESYANSLQN